MSVAETAAVGCGLPLLEAKLAPPLLREGTIPRRAVLVLDDVHLLQRRVCRAVVASLVESVPPGSQVLLTTRAVLDLPYARLRAERQLIELGTSDLRLSDAEAAAVLCAAGASPSEA